MEYLNKPKHLISLASSALIVSVEVHVWTATKQDRVISDEVTSNKGASSDAGKFTKNLLSADPHHKRLVNYRQTVYNWLQRATFDWSGRMRLLPTFDLVNFNKAFSEHDLAFNRLLDDFVLAYPSIVSNAAFKQGSMFDRSEYPDVQHIRNKFSITKFITNVPEGDFRSAVSEALADDLYDHYTNQTRSIVDAITTDAKARLIEVAERMRNSCVEVRADLEAEADGKPQRRRKIYESTLNGISSMVDTLKAFNPNGDPELQEMVTALEDAVKGVTLTDLRESAAARADLHDDLDDILSKFKPIN